jgi:hypothetical protein
MHTLIEKNSSFAAISRGLHKDTSLGIKAVAQRAWSVSLGFDIS